MQNANKYTYLTNIQVLRFAAAAAVVQYHTIDVLASYGFNQTLFAHFKGWGASGVDLFFVISGFVLYKICLEREISAAQFLADRVIRIVPMYWLATLGMALVLILFSKYLRHEQLDPIKLCASLFFVSALSGFSFPTLGVGWTLEYEFLFYGFLTLLLAMRLKHQALPILAIVFLLLSYFDLTGVLVFEFLFGMFIAQNFHHVATLKWGRYLLFIALLLVAVSVFLTGAGINRVLLYGVPSSLLVMSLVSLPQCRRNLFTLLGDSSYSLYLTHQPLLSFVAKVAQKTVPNLNGDVIVFLVIFILFTVGFVAYWFFERPLIGLLKKTVRAHCSSSRVKSPTI